MRSPARSRSSSRFRSLRRQRNPVNFSPIFVYVTCDLPLCDARGISLLNHRVPQLPESGNTTLHCFDMLLISGYYTPSQRFVCVTRGKEQAVVFACWP